MPGDFLDTSALVKHYHSEVGSVEVDQLWSDLSRQLYVSRLSVVEFASVFAGKLRSGAFSTADFELLRKRFSADLTKSKRLSGARMVVAHYLEAERLLRKHGPIRRLRTLDALQLAVALDLKSKGLIQRVVSADRDMLVVAAAEGLMVLDPENPNSSGGTST